jgi:hypothetical protein
VTNVLKDHGRLRDCVGGLSIFLRIK